MGVWDRVKSNTKKLRLQGDIGFLKREANNRKKAFGIELYDHISNDKNKLLGLSANTLFQDNQDGLKEAFEGARDDIAGLQAKKDIKQRGLDVIEVRGASSLPASTLDEKMAKAGRVISNRAKGTKLHAEMALLNREMKLRKERFGLEVYGELKLSNMKEQSDGPGRLSKEEDEVQACFDRAQTDVDSIEERIKAKLLEISTMDEELQPMI